MKTPFRIKLFFVFPSSQPSSIFPSVKCGLEMAILNLLASQRKCSLFKVLSGCDLFCRDENVVEYNQNSSASIQICALVDCNGSPMEVALGVAKLVAEGFTTFKLKVTI
jgi:isochorismate synthase / 2-succinyl-5-enolpyruvyl-6-hydroxy-3-cyclohexene-1-carboxylate synthase / 2-succinyl-6-hydroxy-2,4-cyclohexadiene-1-carboxylate synthase / o-succinylbenzoate synthase